VIAPARKGILNLIRRDGDRPVPGKYEKRICGMKDRQSGVMSFLKKRFGHYAVLKLPYKTVRYLRREGIGATGERIRIYLKKRLKKKRIELNLCSRKQLAEQRRHVFSKDIRFSILVPLYNTPEKFLREMIQSVLDQTYGGWELCLADGSDTQHANVEQICREYVKKDSRIKYQRLQKNLGISGNTNACIDMAAGDYIALLDHDDLLHPAALYENMCVVCDKDADFIYSDEVTFESLNLNRVVTHHFKPDFAPDNLRANNYICHFCTFSKELLEKTGRFRDAYNGSQDHDMVLRLTAKAERIEHIPKVLYYWRSHPVSVAQDVGAKAYVVEAGRNAVKDSISQCGLAAEVESTTVFPTIYRIKYALNDTPLVSIIIPNRNCYSVLKRCIDSIIEKTTYANYEIIIVDNGSSDDRVLAYYEELKTDSRFKICFLNIEFNYSRLNNYAVDFASGSYYVLLNNDTEVIEPGWIEEMLMYVQRDDVAAAGAKLYYPDDTIQHAGIILQLGADRVAGHAFCRQARDDMGYMWRCCYAQDVSAVTGACMMIKASVYRELGGLDESFGTAYNDVDLCMRMRQKGYLIVWTPFAELYHYKSKSRGYEDTPEKQMRFQNEVRRFKERWKKELAKGDPYYNPNLTLDRGDFSIRL